VIPPLAYLSGAIEHAADGGTGWRRDTGRFLQEELGHRVYDPAADQKKDLSEEEQASFRGWKLAAPDRFQSVVRKIIAWDLGWIEGRVDYLIALWDEPGARGGGTSAEITLAHRLGKPVYLVLGMPRADASGWILACADRVFEDFDALREFLTRTYL
jgi:hypothetical protein